VRADIYCGVLMKQERLPCICHLLSPLFICGYVELIGREILIVLQSIYSRTRLRCQETEIDRPSEPSQTEETKK